MEHRAYKHTGKREIDSLVRGTNPLNHAIEPRIKFRPFPPNSLPEQPTDFRFTKRFIIYLSKNAALYPSHCGPWKGDCEITEEGIERRKKETKEAIKTIVRYENYERRVVELSENMSRMLVKMSCDISATSVAIFFFQNPRACHRSVD